jgi:hypothetical protein
VLPCMSRCTPNLPKVVECELQVLNSVLKPVRLHRAVREFPPTARMNSHKGPQGPRRAFGGSNPEHPWQGAIVPAVSSPLARPLLAFVARARPRRALAQASGATRMTTTFVHPDAHVNGAPDDMDDAASHFSALAPWQRMDEVPQPARPGRSRASYASMALHAATLVAGCLAAGLAGSWGHWPGVAVGTVVAVATAGTLVASVCYPTLCWGKHTSTSAARRRTGAPMMQTALVTAVVALRVVLLAYLLALAGIHLGAPDRAWTGLEPQSCPQSNCVLVDGMHPELAHGMVPFAVRTSRTQLANAVEAFVRGQQLMRVIGTLGDVNATTFIHARALSFVFGFPDDLLVQVRRLRPQRALGPALRQPSAVRRSTAWTRRPLPTRRAGPAWATPICERCSVYPCATT